MPPAYAMQIGLSYEDVTDSGGETAANGSRSNVASRAWSGARHIRGSAPGGPTRLIV